MNVRGPDQENSFVFHEPEPEREPTTTYLAELGKAIAILFALGGGVALAFYTYRKWGFAFFVFWK